MIRTALLVATLSAAPLVAQTNTDDLTPLEISYSTTVSEDMKRLHIGMVIEKVGRPTLHLVMPKWSPGAYRIGNYADGVRDLKVIGADGTELEITQMDGNSWSVATAGQSELHVSYSKSAARRRRFGGSTNDEDAEITGVSYSGPSTYLYVRGAKDRPVTCSYAVPEGWSVANGLLPTGEDNVRYARDYDTFIDAPTIIGHYEERSFEVAGTPFSCVFFEQAQEYDFDIDAFVEITRKIVVNQGELYGTFPFPNYVFLFSLPGGGGLEHLNSTSIGLRAPSQKKDPNAGASVTSHEFFHTWNVKRIRPKVLGPFDYEQENYTGNLWVSEGWTSYFGDLTLARIGVWDRDRYLSHLSGIISREFNKERRQDHSVAWASRNAWHRFNNEEGSRVSYYDKGEILGMLIDIEIRRQTNGQKSLNDVMRFLNRWFAERGVGFEEGDIERACTAVSNHDFSEFFARHVNGTMDPDMGDYLACVGIDYAQETIPCSFPFAVRGTRVSGRRSADTPELEEGEVQPPRPGETIVSIDGVEFENSNDFLRGHQPGELVMLTLERRDETREVEVTLAESARMIPTLAWSENPGEEQLAMREAWLTSTQ